MKPKSVESSTEFKNIRAISSSFGENKDCSVVAVSIALGIDYAAAHALCTAHGRKPGRGMRHRSPLPTITAKMPSDLGGCSEAANALELHRRCAECRTLQIAAKAPAAKLADKEEA